MSLNSQDQAAADRIARFYGIDQPLVLVLEGKPASKARPRFARNGRAYTPAESRAAEKRTSEALATLLTQPLEGGVALGCVFYRPDFHRIDVDNMLKHVCDAANKVLWLDDSQVTGVCATVEVDAERPRTLIVLGPYATTMNRQTAKKSTCPQCFRDFETVWNSKRRYCSRACVTAAAKSKNPPIECPSCNRIFQPRSPRQFTCSRKCSYSRAAQQAAAELPLCISCNQEVSTKDNVRCRECWKEWQREEQSTDA